MSITDHVDRVTLIPESHKCAKPPVPHAVKIELTGRCNFRCSYCARSMKLRDQQDMDRGFFERILLEMRGAGVSEIGLFYLGESFMVPWLADAIFFAKHRAQYPYVFLTTNGALSTPDKVEACMKAGLDSLKFSLNYANEEQFKDIARMPGRHFQTIKDNIKAAYEIREANGYKTGLYASYIDYTGAQREQMQPLIEEMTPYLDDLYALPLYNQADLVASDEKSRGWNIRAGNPGRAAAMREPIPCWAVFTETRITWDGHLSACCFDHDGRFHMGDLSSQGFLDCWHSPEFQSLRLAHLSKNIAGTACESCVAYK